MKAPFRTLTVTDGRETLGFINQQGLKRFTALLASTGEKIGPFQTAADAAQALSDARKKGSE